MLSFNRRRRRGPRARRSSREEKASHARVNVASGKGTLLKNCRYLLGATVGRQPASRPAARAPCRDGTPRDDSGIRGFAATRVVIVSEPASVRRPYTALVDNERGLDGRRCGVVPYCVQRALV